jgi:hypothetical protein
MAEWLRVKNGAEYASVCERTFRSLLKEGLPYSRLPSGMILIKRSDIDAFLGKFVVKEGSSIDAIVDHVMDGIRR